MCSPPSQLFRPFRDDDVDPGDPPIKMLEQKSEGTPSLNDLDKPCDLVPRVASSFRYDPIIVIDALHECADIEALLRALVTLKQADVRLLVTSSFYGISITFLGEHGQRVGGVHSVACETRG